MNKKIIAAALLCFATLTSCNGETVIETVKNPVEVTGKVSVETASGMSKDEIKEYVNEAVEEAIKNAIIEAQNEERHDYRIGWYSKHGMEYTYYENLTYEEYEEVKNEKLLETEENYVSYAKENGEEYIAYYEKYNEGILNCEYYTDKDKRNMVVDLDHIAFEPIWFNVEKDGLVVYKEKFCINAKTYEFIDEDEYYEDKYRS